MIASRRHLTIVLLIVAVQGVRSVLIVAVIGLAFGLTARLRRSLVPGMLTHAALDLYALTAM